MAEGRQSAAVSRSEFYGTLSVTWVYIPLVVGNQLTEQATLPKYLLFAGALGMSLWITARSYQSRAGNTGGA
jgi:hypothetical protein